MDAAVAACAVQCVVEPGSTGIGGDCFCLYAPKGTADYVAYNGSGRAPENATLEWFEKNGIGKIELSSPHAVTVPGAVDAWDTLIRDHGRLSLKEILRPAINYARDGYPISSRVAADFVRNTDKLKKCDNAASVFLKNGEAPKTGDVHRQEKLADTLEIIADEGRSGFYEGRVSVDIVNHLQSSGGLHTLGDFAQAKGQYVKPISTSYLGYDVYQCPPNGQGIIALMLLKLMERYGKSPNGPMDISYIHQEIEAGRLAYHLRDAYLADPDHNDVPVNWLLSDGNIDNLFSRINPEYALKNLSVFKPPEHRDTVYITVVDQDRNCCSFINTLFHGFGSGMMTPKSGVLLHNRGAGFNLIKGHPNSIAPHKRPLHTIIPGMVAKNGRTVMSYGVMGGAYQAFGHMQFLSRFLNYGFDIQEAQDLPRYFPNPETGNVDIESTMTDETVQSLINLGHKPVPSAIPIGGSQAIWIDRHKNTLTGGSDPRKDGCAIGF